MVKTPPFANPFRPGAGHMPPYLAGREQEKQEFARLLDQDPILENVVLTGLRGVGKTVLLETLKPMAMQRGWLWVGTDLSEAASVTEQSLSIRLLADLSVVTSGMVIGAKGKLGFGREGTTVQTMDFQFLSDLYNGTPGLAADKLKAVLEAAAAIMSRDKRRGLVFAYDEAQNLVDTADRDEYPLSLLLDVFQSIQRKGIPFLLVLTGLPTLFPKLVEARTFSERMFRVVTLDKLDTEDSKQAIVKPITDAKCPVRFSAESVAVIVRESGGYPYFIQFICREVYDVFIQQLATDKTPSVPVEAITRKLDTDFFAGRWARATDRQRELLFVIAMLGKPAEAEFTVQDVATKSKEVLSKPFGASHVNQMLVVLGEAGLIYKNRHGRYSFAVPLFDQFIIRQMAANGPEQPL
jgi:hypothetical protein